MRIVIEGPQGSGKSQLARRMATWLVRRGYAKSCGIDKPRGEKKSEIEIVTRQRA